MLLPDTIFTAIEQVFPVTRADIIGPRRRRSEAEGRHLFCWILHTHGRMSLGQIGGIINRDHSGIRYAVDAAQNLYDTCQPYRRMANKVLDALDLAHEQAA